MLKGSPLPADTVDTQAIADRAVTSEKLTPTIAFRAYDSGGTTLTDNTAVKINLATEDYDYGSDFASSTFTAPVAGVYHFSATVISSAIASHVAANIRIYKNGSVALYGGGSSDATGYVFNVSGELLLAANDTVELYFFQNSGGNETTITGTDATWMSGYLVGGV